MSTETRKKLDPKALEKLGLKLVEGPPEPIEIRPAKAGKKVNAYADVVGEELALLIATAPANPLTLELVRSSLKIVPDIQPKSREEWVEFIERTPLPARAAKAEVQPQRNRPIAPPQPEVPRNREGIDGFTVTIQREETEYGRADYQQQRVVTGTLFVPMVIFEQGAGTIRTYVAENDHAFVAQTEEHVPDTKEYTADEVIDTEVDDRTIANLGEVMERYNRR